MRARSMHPSSYLLGWLFPFILAGAPAAFAEDIWLFDNSHYYGLVKGVTGRNQLKIQLPNGDIKTVPLEEVIAIRFVGRIPLLVQSGTQEFRFVSKGRLRGQVLKNKGDLLSIRTAMAGKLDIDLRYLKGFLALPMAGFSGRKAKELVERERDKRSRFLDTVLDRRGSTYSGVVRKLTRTHLYLDHEDLLQVVPVKISYVAGVRMAEATRDPKKSWKGTVLLRMWGRDGSVVRGTISRIYLGKWHVNPSWNSRETLSVPLDEISQVEILGGRVQYLSQLVPVEVEEKTILAPPQPYRMDRSCQGDSISIAGKRYPWGVGVHADSKLIFALNGKFKEFRAEIGISTRMGANGSVIFHVLGDGKELYKGPVVRGSDKEPLPISVPVKGIQRLTVKVTHSGDLDLGDVANWGSARVLR